MAQYLVKPKHRNGYYAPGLLVEATDKNKARESAKDLSNLSKSKDWKFRDCKQLSTRTLSGRQAYE